MKSILGITALLMTGCASVPPQTHLALERDHRIERIGPLNPNGLEVKKPLAPDLRRQQSRGGDKNDPGGYEGSGGTGDGGG